MAAKKLTILIFPQKTNKIRRVVVPRRLLSVLSMFLILIILGLGWLINDYRKIKTQVPELRHLQKENKFQKTQLISLTSKINQINQKMCELQEFSHKLRVMTDLGSPEGEEQILGIGGSDFTSLNTNLDLDDVQKSLMHDMHKSLDELDTNISVASISQIELSSFLKEQKSMLAHTPSIKPTEGWFSSGFGYRVSPFTNKREFHKGLDIATRVGTEVIAPADGLVVFAGAEGNYGKMISMNHGFNMKTRYGHLHKILVKKGDRVKRGQIIAQVGKTGRCTGSHLHYEVHLNGVPVNPLRYILN